MKKQSIAGIALAALPLLTNAQAPAVDMEAMARRQQELEKLIRDQGARIAELERLLKSQSATPAPAGATPSTAPVAPAAAVASTPAAAATSPTPDDIEPAAESGGPEYIPNGGFKIYESDKAQIYMRLFSYARYLNQKGLDPTYTDSFGNVKEVVQREDFQLNKFFLPFSGWFLDPKWRYYLYVWSANTAQGDPAQVVGAGNLSYVANSYVTIGAGITSLPSVRSTEGQFPYWLGVDDRLIADEFFRGSYTTGVWLKGQVAPGLNYMAMLANNLSTLGISASQLDNNIDTWSVMLNWMPTTHEFGPLGAFGDFEGHEQLATRVGIHFTSSTEDRQSQPGTDTIENSQIRLTDGNVIFTPGLFGPGIVVDQVAYEMASLDAGFKYRGYSVEAELYRRKLSDYRGPGVSVIDDITDDGFQVQVSAMLMPRLLQVYAGASGIYGDYGDASEIRAGFNYFPQRMRGIRLNGEWIQLDNSPVGYTAVPYPVGGNGNVYHMNFELNF